MTRVISGTYNLVVQLTTATDNPASISAGALINQGVYGSKTADWALTNDGQVHSGIKLHAGGTVTNDAGGVITGEVINVGLYIYKPGSVTNAGRISSGSTTSGQGVELKQGGQVSNQSGGTITGGVYGIALGAIGTVQNSGTITNTSTTNGAGIILRTDGVVTNQAVGLISGFSAIIGIGTETVVNYGSLSGLTGYGVRLELDGSVVNSFGGVISAVLGGIRLSGTATVRNAGRIASTSTGASAVLFVSGGLLNNTGTITGASGVRQAGAAKLTLVNSGEIDGNPASTALQAVYIADGSVTNQSGGTINGATGIRGELSKLYPHQFTILNVGAITGGMSAANAGINLASAAARITNQAGGTIQGYVGITGSQIGSTVNAGSAAIINYGVISGYGSHSGTAIQLFGRSAVTNQSGGTISGATGIVLAAGGTIVNAGLIQTRYGNTLTGTSTVMNSGTIQAGLVNTGLQFAANYANRLIVAPNSTIQGEVEGGYVAGATAFSTLELAAAGTARGTLTSIGYGVNNFKYIQFDPGGLWYVSGNRAGFSGTITGFGSGDTIQVAGVTASGFSYAGGELTLTQAGGASAYLNLPEGGTLTTANFSVVNKPLGADIMLVPCFARGTRLATAEGEVPVEQIAVGDTVRAHFAGLASVAWIGYRHVDCTRHAIPSHVWPVHIAAGAFGRGLPRRDLRLSPDHAVFVDGVLIQVKHLINGRSIVQVPVDDVAYYHVELPRHDVVLAEGLPVESYLDTGDRANFANGGAPVRMHPDFASRNWEAFGCAPIVVTGPRLGAVRRRLRRRASRCAVAGPLDRPVVRHRGVSTA